ncbi:hypothetical protein [Nostoc sp.]|uniref:hypothetical protein n=1 Tax=Nostoc sp. TaxID=1180 RepID=UPI002FF22112
MNWKTLSLIAGLILTTSLTACSSSPASNNQIAPEASPAMSKDKAGDAMGKDAMGKDKAGDAMGKDAMGKDAMGKDAMGKDAMGKDADKAGGAMGKDKTGDAMKQSPASTKP